MDPDKDAQKMQELAQELARQFTASMRLQQPPISGQHSGANQPANANVTSTSAETDAKIAEMAKQLGSLLNNTAAQSGPLQKTPIATAAKAQDDQDPFASVPEPSIFERDFTNTYAGVNASVLAYENRELLDLASDQMPIGRFFEEAEAMAKEYPDDSLDDIVIRRLLHWFKNEYFTWVNAPPCVNCQGGTVGIGGVTPTSQESQDGARVVETYRCAQACSDITRFPRYGGMSKVLFKTRRGRCGEWANCFTVCCRALGYKTRYVHDTTDHVWTEVWSEHKKRWIHCDSCEAAYDQPLLYTTGWGKSLSYCVAFSAEEVVDVTRRYTVDYDTVVSKRRRSIREPVLAKYLHRLSEANLTRQGLTPIEMLAVRERQAMEKDELTGITKDSRAIESQDRQSGSDEWAKARGERR